MSQPFGQSREDVRRVLPPVAFDEAAQGGAGEDFQLRDRVHAKPRQVSGRAVEFCAGKPLVHRAHVNGVKGMKVEYRLDVLAAAGQCVDLALHSAALRLGIEKHEPAIGTTHQRALGTDIKQSADLERSANIQEVN